MNDSDYMDLAISLSKQARVTAPPNPWVGCVIVKDRIIVGEGYSRPAGDSHAEVTALQAAGEKAKGATAYVTLEPCSHYGRTAPCCKALAEAGIVRVVIGVIDPDPKVSGKGIAYLDEQNIAVSLGVREKEIEKIFAPYLHHRKTGNPYVVAKSAISVDGRIAAVDGTSKWITPPEARADAHTLRAESQAILIGVGTAIADNPLLTVRDTNPLPPKQPLRVVLDSKGRLPIDSPLVAENTLIATTEQCEKQADWEAAGAEVIFFPGKQVPITSLLKELGKRGIIQVLVEGGSGVMGTLLKERLINHFVVYVGPKIIGAGGIPAFGDFSVGTIEDAPLLQLQSVRQIGQAARLDFGVR